MAEAYKHITKQFNLSSFSKYRTELIGISTKRAVFADITDYTAKDG